MRSSSSFLLLRGVSFSRVLCSALASLPDCSFEGFFPLRAHGISQVSLGVFLTKISQVSSRNLLRFLCSLLSPRVYTWTDGFMNMGYDRDVAELATE